MKKIAIAAVMIAGAMFAAETKPAAKKAADTKPDYSNYNQAMASSKNCPSAVEWQKANDAALKKATSCEVLAGFVKNEQAALALLAKVQPAYATDPVVATQIASVSQWVMLDDQKRSKGFMSRFKNSPRKVWVKALLKSAQNAKDDYIKEYFLDQLRWCGCAEQAKAVLEIGKKSGSKNVLQFAEMVARELNAAKSAR